MKLVARHILVDQMARKGWSNRGLAEFVGCAPGTIDNLVAGRTQSVNGQHTARRISEALELPVEVFFVPVLSSVAVHNGNRIAQLASGEPASGEPASGEPASGEEVPTEEGQSQGDPEF